MILSSRFPSHFLVFYLSRAQIAGTIEYLANYQMYNTNGHTMIVAQTLQVNMYQIQQDDDILLCLPTQTKHAYFSYHHQQDTTIDKCYQQKACQKEDEI